MNKINKLVCVLGLCAQSTYSFATEAKVTHSLQSEWLHYLLFDLAFIALIGLLYCLYKVLLTHSGKKQTKHSSLYNYIDQSHHRNVRKRQ
ncbi:MAG: hypothetical protein ABJH28_10435 [Paraglaciecola sp.]|uniref:hypothetical protein n=1 Tax=Paraglaciecola sp. TaxID=1920173 RepID=UPI003265F89C